MKPFKLPKLSPTYIATVVFAILFLLIGNRVAGKTTFHSENEKADFVRARVTAVLSVSKDKYGEASDGLTMTNVVFEAKALNGYQKGEALRCSQTLDSLFALSVPQVKVRDTVLLEYTEPQEGGEEAPDYVMVEFVRTGPLIWLTILFAVLVLLFGRKKGADTLLSFVFSIAAIFAVLVPALLSGRDIYGWSLLICVFIVVTNLLLVQGPSAKCLAAGLGCLGGVLAAGAIILAVNRPMHIAGLMNEEAIYLKDLGIDIKAIVFCMIMIGSMGALMDMAMDIASALHELREKHAGITAAELMRSGINIGQDLIGTMANTLILAYIGESMAFLLVMIYFSSSTTVMMNMEIIAVSILQCLAGCLSLLAVVPLTSLFCSMFYLRGKPKTVWYESGEDEEAE